MVSDLFKPVMYQKDIFDVNYDKLKKSGIKYLLFDIDNTIAETNVKKPSKSVIELFRNLKDKGFEVMILTNAIPLRARRFARVLGVDYFCLSFKPLSYNYKRILKKYKAEYNKMCAIGDQICTDVKGANKLGIISILVEPLSPKEGISTKLNRVKEKKIIKKYKVITRGEFYE